MPTGRRADQNIVEYLRHSKAYRSRMFRPPYTLVRVDDLVLHEAQIHDTEPMMHQHDLKALGMAHPIPGIIRAAVS